LQKEHELPPQKGIDYVLIQRDRALWAFLFKHQKGPASLGQG